MKQIPFYRTKIEGSFWGERQRVSADVTVGAVYDRFRETKRFDAVKCDVAQQEREGWRPHIFWDSDTAKWIEGAAYILERGRDAELEAKIDDLVSDFCKNQLPDGYYNCFYNVYNIDKRFTVRTDHELYCLGHLIEAAIAYYHATGKDRLLGMVEKYVDHVIKVFVEDKSAAFVTPGHEEIELALVKLYRLTGNEKYLDLAKFFVNSRGNNGIDKNGYYDWANASYAQDHLPVREQTTAEGHSVRAMYLYCAMADLALETGDGALLAACDRIFDNVAEKRMYITGGIGSTCIGEAFTTDYDLPNEKAYTETCATLALALFCRRMTSIKPNGRYGDVAELAMYNGSISGVSLSGDEFFYENPLTVDLRNHGKNVATEGQEHYPISQRVRIFDCSCCPPNILRFINSIADFLYTEDGDTLYVNHFMNSKTESDGRFIRQTTDYPSDGKVKIETSGYKNIAVRVPGWCDCFTASCDYDLRDGYAYFEAGAVEVDFHIRPRFVASSPSVHENAGRVALMYGPVTYCVEGVDNSGDIFTLSADPESGFEIARDDYFGLPVITADVYERIGTGRLYYPASESKTRKRKLRFIPYYGMENRAETDMIVWLPSRYI